MSKASDFSSTSVVWQSTAPADTNVVWADSANEKVMVYNQNTAQWESIGSLGLVLGNAADRDYTISSTSPSGGSDGDVWYEVL